MKVAYLLGSLNRGGTETLLLDVFHKADKAPYEMICIHRKGGSYLDEYYSSGIKMIQCAPKRFGILRYLWQLRSHLLREKVTVVHAQQSIDCVYARLATMGTNIRVVETFHGYDFAASRFGKMIFALSLRWADAVCFVSEAQKDYYEKVYKIHQKGKIHIAYNGIDFEKFNIHYPVPDFLLQQDVSASKRIHLAMVGNFVRVRAQMTIVQSLDVLYNTCNKSFDFYFIGRRDETEPWRYDNCVQYCDEHDLNDFVHFIGGRSDVPAILQHIDAFIYASDHDTFGIAVVEAIAASLPVVVNDWPVMQEVCGEENDGIRYFKTGDAKDAADKIAVLLSNIEKSKKAAEANALRIREQYSIEKHIERLNEIYLKIF